MKSKQKIVSFYSLLLLLLFSLIFVACKSDRKKKVNLENFTFSTTDASELYFKNIRESYYQVEVKEGIKIFRLKDYEELDSIIIKPIIVYHWRVDKAFLMLEFQPEINSENIQISESASEKNYQVIQIKDHLLLANDLYNMLSDEKEPHILIEKRKIPVFGHKLEKSYFSLVLYDFYRFTNIY